MPPPALGPEPVQDAWRPPFASADAERAAALAESTPLDARPLLESLQQ